MANGSVLEFSFGASLGQDSPPPSYLEVGIPLLLPRSVKPLQRQIEQFKCLVCVGLFKHGFDRTFVRIMGIRNIWGLAT